MAADAYTGKSTLMANYGWVQNSSNLSTVRDTVDLIPAQGLSHNELMRAIRDQRAARGNLPSRWTWDARCRIKAVCATGMAELDRPRQGYRLTELGTALQSAVRAEEQGRKRRPLSPEEQELFRKGLLTNPPVVRVLSLLQEARLEGRGPLSKYEVGGGLGFLGDPGFTHYTADYAAASGRGFDNMEGDADKWARTILSWLMQVGWVQGAPSVVLSGQSLARYSPVDGVDRVLRYQVRSAVKYVPQEMLCSAHHSFAGLIQRRRVALLEALAGAASRSRGELTAALEAAGLEADGETVDFDILNLRQAGLKIDQEQGQFRLLDKLKLDVRPEKPAPGQRVDGVEREIEHYVAVYWDTLPPRLVDDLIRYGRSGARFADRFEAAVNQFFSHLGYEVVDLGQGHGRVADGLAKYRDALAPRSYGLILDAKASDRYSFPAGDVRKMKEYIVHHGQELYQDAIPRHAFLFVSMDFTEPGSHLEEIARDTAVDGAAADVFTLLELGARVMRKELALRDLYPAFTTNDRFRCPA